MEDSDYLRYRGKCKILSEELIAKDNTLTLVRGYYYCPIWNSNEQHWWTIKSDGTIVDPTSRQFPSNGHGIYTPFNGICVCEQCGKEIIESEAYIDGHHVFCTSTCYARCIGF